MAPRAKTSRSTAVPSKSMLLSSDVTVPPEVTGLQCLLTPFAQFISSQRSTMFASHISQYLVIKGAEIPRVMSGYEIQIGKFEFNETVADQDIQIVGVIPKFMPNFGSRQIKENPAWTVIYIGCKDRKVGCFDIHKVTKLHGGFGYANDLTAQHMLKTNTFVPKGTVFAQAPNHRNNNYMPGTNANICFMTMHEATEDALVVSDELADKMESLAIDTIDLMLRPEDVPLNLYGSDDEFKMMPDVGEPIRSDGIVVAFRSLRDPPGSKDKFKQNVTFMSDMTNRALQQVEYLHDKINSAICDGGQVIDIQVFVNPRVYNALRKEENVYNQLIKYQEQHLAYYRAVDAVYKQYVTREGLQCTPEFNQKVTQCKGHILSFEAQQQTRLHPCKGKEPVDFIYLKITYAAVRKATVGSKITGRDGAKGIISAIWPKKDMPRAYDGTIADLIASPESGFNRVNPGQFYEQFFNVCGVEIHKRVCTMDDWTAYKYVMEFMEDIRPVYRQFVEQHLTTDEAKLRWIADVREKGIYLIISPFCENITPELVIKLADKYQIEKFPVTFHFYRDGERVEVTTRKAVMIGSKYVYLLGKLPSDQLSAVGIGYLNQFGTPTKPSSGAKTKVQMPFGCTPMRFGEDETALLMMSIGPEATSRLMGLHSNSWEGTRAMAMQLLTAPKPSNLGMVPISTEDLINTSSTIGVFRHLLGVIGYEPVHEPITQPITTA